MHRSHARDNTVLADYMLRGIDRNISDRHRSSYVRMSDFEKARIHQFSSHHGGGYW